MSLKFFLEMFPPQTNIPLYHYHFQHYHLIYTIIDNISYPLILINHFKQFQPPHYYHLPPNQLSYSFHNPNSLISYITTHTLPI